MGHRTICVEFSCHLIGHDHIKNIFAFYGIAFIVHSRKYMCGSFLDAIGAILIYFKDGLNQDILFYFSLHLSKLKKMAQYDL